MPTTGSSTDTSTTKPILFFSPCFTVYDVTARALKSLFTNLRSIVSKVTKTALELLFNNRWFIVIAVTATIVGALLPFAGVPALAGLLAIKVTSLAAASVPVMAVINAGLFLAAAFVARGLDMAANWVCEKIATLLKNGIKPTEKSNSLMSRLRLVPEPVDDALLGAGKWVARNPLPTFFATLIVGSCLAMGPAVGLLALGNYTVSPLAGFLLNGLFGLLISVPAVGSACCFPTITPANSTGNDDDVASLDSYSSEITRRSLASSCLSLGKLLTACCSSSRDNTNAQQNNLNYYREI